MHRLVIALTTLLALIGAAVVAGYLFIFGPTVDRAATMAPATSLAYVSVYLSPSTGQEMNLADLLTRLPGFSDRATLADKLDEIVQRALTGAGVDYHENVKPWLGDQLALAVVPAPAQAGGGLPAAPVVIAAVRDEAAAKAAMGRIAAANGSTLRTASYGGVTIDLLGGSDVLTGEVAIVDHMLIATSDATVMHAVIDTATGNGSRLSDAGAFRDAMATLPADRLATVYVDVTAAGVLGGGAIGTSGYSTAAVAVLARSDGIRIVGSAPFTANRADASNRSTFALGSEPSSLSDWMPPATEAEAVVFGARGLFESITSELGAMPGGQDAAQALTELRALAALGLGIDIDTDLLPLFDREAAVAVQGISQGTPSGQLLLRPSDPASAATALGRIADGLRSRGADVRQQEAAGTSITVIAIPQVGQMAYAVSGGIIVAGLSADDVAAALEAHASGETLGAATGYRAAFDVAGGRGGNELYLEGARGVDLILGLLGQSTDSLPADVRDILSQVGAVALSTPAEQNRIEIHATVTVK